MAPQTASATSAQAQLTTRARDLFDKVFANGKSYVELTRSTIENEAQDILGRVRTATNRGQEAVQSRVGEGLEQARKIEHDLLSRAEELVKQFGAEVEKRVPAAQSATHNAVQLAEQLLKNVDGRLQTLLGSAASAVWALPIDGYDDMNVGQATSALKQLSTADLELVKAYEEAHKARKTVLREIDQLLQA